jgi:hypothetical protein
VQGLRKKKDEIIENNPGFVLRRALLGESTEEERSLGEFLKRPWYWLAGIIGLVVAVALRIIPFQVGTILAELLHGAVVSSIVAGIGLLLIHFWKVWKEVKKEFSENTIINCEIEKFSLIVEWGFT